MTGEVQKLPKHTEIISIRHVQGVTPAGSLEGPWVESEEVEQPHVCHLWGGQRSD